MKNKIRKLIIVDCFSSGNDGANYLKPARLLYSPFCYPYTVDAKHIAGVTNII